MKLNIIHSKEMEITGYKNINVLDASSLSGVNSCDDYSCEDIIIATSVNLLSRDDACQLIDTLFKKLSMRGTINISVFDLDYLFTLNSSQQINDTLPRIKCYITLENLKQIVAENNAKIVSLTSLEGVLNIIGTKIFDETK